MTIDPSLRNWHCQAKANNFQLLWMEQKMSKYDWFASWSICSDPKCIAWWRGQPGRSSSVHDCPVMLAHGPCHGVCGAVYPWSVLTCVFDIYVCVCVCVCVYVFGLIANHFSRARAVVPSELINQSYCSPSLHGFPNKDRDSGHKMMEALVTMVVEARSHNGHNGITSSDLSPPPPPPPTPLSFN